MRLMRTVTISVAFCIGGVFLSATPASAATSTVCATGCDHTTIQAAVTAAAAGDTINVGAGTYNEFGIIIDKPLTIQGAGEGTTIVDGGGGSVGSVPGIFRILPGLAAKGSGAISISDMTLQNPNKNTTATQYFAISIGVKQLTTGISRIDLDGLEIKGPGDPAKTGYGIYADGGLTGGVDRVAPEFTLTNSKISGQTYNGLGLDAWRGKATVDGNELFEGTNGQSAILVMNEYTPSRMTDPVIVTNNTSQGRLISVRNDVPGNFGGYDDIQITDNEISGLTASDFGVRVGSSTTTSASAHIAKAVIENNSIRGDGTSAGTSGVLILGFVQDAQVNENNIVGVGTGINVVLNQTQSAVTVSAQRNRLFADTTGLANATAAAVNATENWWGCQDGPTSASTYCSPVTNTGGGTVDTSTWVVTTASLDATIRRDRWHHRCPWLVGPAEHGCCRGTSVVLCWSACGIHRRQRHARPGEHHARSPVLCFVHVHGARCPDERHRVCHARPGGVRHHCRHR